MNETPAALACPEISTKEHVNLFHSKFQMYASLPDISFNRQGNLAVMRATERKERPFRVVVVGAGIAGLVLSNSLQRAGVDHVVIEKHRDIVYPSGASIGVWPNGSRLLSQLGVLDSLKNACSEMNVSYNRTPNGKAIIESRLFDEIISR